MLTVKEAVKDLEKTLDNLGTYINNTRQTPNMDAAALYVNDAIHYCWDLEIDIDKVNVSMNQEPLEKLELPDLPQECGEEFIELANRCIERVNQIYDDGISVHNVEHFNTPEQLGAPTARKLDGIVYSLQAANVAVEKDVQERASQGFEL